MVRFEDVYLRYGRGPDILQRVTFRLEPGSFHFLVGPSGAGKSSLLKLLYLGQQPTRGRLSLFGRDIAKLDRDERALLRRRIGVIFQDFRLIGHLSVFENVALPLRISGEAESHLRPKVEELLAWVGLADCITALPATLSGGQQQRIAIARAVISRPSLIVADEPTGNVDDRIAMRLMHLFVELHRSGTTVLIATHNEGLVQRIDKPALHLSGGTLLSPESESSVTPAEPDDPAGPVPS